jgi:hypothetical protein
MKTHEEYMNMTIMSYNLYPRPRLMVEAPQPLQRARRHIFRGGRRIHTPNPSFRKTSHIRSSRMIDDESVEMLSKQVIKDTMINAVSEASSQGATLTTGQLGQNHHQHRRHLDFRPLINTITEGGFNQQRQLSRAITRLRVGADDIFHDIA